MHLDLQWCCGQVWSYLLLRRSLALLARYFSGVSDPNVRLVLNLAALESSLAAARWQGPVPTILETTESTNNDVARLAAAGAAEGSCIVAEHQSAGRGRQARTWVSPPSAGLWMSVLVRPGDMPRDTWTWLPLIAGLSACDAVRETSGVQASLKWPNDLVVVQGSQSPRKLAGVLSEAIDDHSVVLGIGINVSLTKDELPIPTATSLLLEGGSVNREELLASVLVHLAHRLGQWRVSDHSLVSDYRAACVTIGRKVEVTLPDQVVLAGIVVDVDDQGHLVVDDGADTVIVTAGDVIHATI
ncbi:MAG: biotin--[acetyl-CoA-carboxylase] ligase [Actinobacteria bacterium]|nr:biotin--[acetyl-CoA-carboxylase] ligase [Actinomycetota bacterium]